MKCPAKLGGGFARLRDEKHAGRIAVETMDETRALAAEAITHAFEHAVEVFLRPRSTLHSEAERLVQNKNLLVFVEDHFFDGVAVAFRNAGRGL